MGRGETDPAASKPEDFGLATTYGPSQRGLMAVGGFRRSPWEGDVGGLDKQRREGTAYGSRSRSVGRFFSLELFSLGVDRLCVVDARQHKLQDINGIE